MTKPYCLKIISFILLSMAAISLASANEWNNPGDRYKDAYKKYITAACPIAKDNISHFVYFTKDRKRMRGHEFLKYKRFSGAQIMYSWKQLEPRKGRYDFSIIRSDIKYLEKYEKRLFIQLQDVSFSAKYKAVPDYLLGAEYDGGVIPSKANGKTIGWIAKRWNPSVQMRFTALLEALGEEFDGVIEGINLQETAIEASKDLDANFSPEIYATVIQDNMRALKTAFPTSTKIQYANFMPGEWLPWEDEGYLKSLYQTGEEIGVGLGAPDLMFKRRGQLNHALAMMHEGDFSVPIGIAVQDGNYVGSTGADEHFKERQSGAEFTQSMVPTLHAFAKDFLKVDYMFWVDQKPYFKDQVLPCFEEK